MISPSKYLSIELRNDPDMYRAYVDNIAMAFKDAYDIDTDMTEKRYKSKEDIHRISNQAAKNFLKSLGV